MNLLDYLRQSGKLYFTVNDLVRITGYRPASIYVLLNRLVKQEKLVRLANNCYILPEKINNLALIANQLYFPSYLSCETVLAQHGVLSQQPYSLIFMTTRKTRTITLGNRRCIYHMLKAELFSDYIIQDSGLWVATPEKALFDLIYLNSRGRMYTDFSQFDLSKIEIPRLAALLECANLRNQIKKINK